MGLETHNLHITWRISIQDFIHYLICIILILEEKPVFHFLISECQTRELLVPFFNIFGMTRSLTVD